MRIVLSVVANVSDGGLDCRCHNNNNRLDTRSIQNWIDDALGEHLGETRYPCLTAMPWTKGRDRWNHPTW